MKLALTAIALLGIGCAAQIPVYNQREHLGQIETPAGNCHKYSNISSDGDSLTLSLTTESNGRILETLAYTMHMQDGECRRIEVSDTIDPSYAQQMMEQYILENMFSFYTETRMVDLACDGTVNLMYLALDNNTETLKRGIDFSEENDEMLEMQVELMDDSLDIGRQIEGWRSNF